MAPYDALIAYLGRWDSRRRAQEALLWLPRALIVATLLALALALAARVRPVLTRVELSLAALALLGLAAAVAMLVVALRRRTLEQQARFADRQFGLRQRAITALEVAGGRLQTTPEMARQQLDDTLAAAGAVDVERQMPLAARRGDLLALATLLAFVLIAIWTPNIQEAALLQQRGVAAAVGESRQALEALSAGIEQNEALTPEQREALQQPLSNAQQSLEGSPSQEEALAALSGAEGEMRQLASDLGAAGLRESLPNAASGLANTAPSQALGEALQQDDLGQAAAEAGALADQLEGMDHGTQGALAESLLAAASGLQGADPQLAEQLQAAADALEQGDTAAAQEALGQAAETLAERDQGTEAARQASSAAGQLGQARQEVAQAGGPAAQEQAPQAGEGQQGQQGQDQQGQGEQAGTGEQGQGQGPGGQSGEGQGQGQGQQGSNEGGGAGGPGPGGGHTENVFVPGGLDLSGESGADIELPVQCLADPESCGPLAEQTPNDPNDPDQPSGSIVPYEQVYGVYRDAAYEALESGDIPLSLRELVRDYFTNLAPNE